MKRFPINFFLLVVFGFLFACALVPATTRPTETPIAPSPTPAEPSPTLETDGFEPAPLTPTPEASSTAVPFSNQPVISPANASQLGLLKSLPTVQDAQIVWAEDGTQFLAFYAFNSTAVQLYSLLSETPTVLEHPQAVTSAAFSADGKHIVSASQGGLVRVWETTTGKETSHLSLTSFFQYSLWADSVAFSPDGTKLAVFGSQDSMLLLFNFPFDNTPPTSLAWTEHAAPVVSVYPSPDWQTFAWVGRGTLVLMNADGTFRGEPIHHEDFIMNLFYSPDGKALFIQTAQTINDVYSGVVIVYDVQTGQPLQTFAHPDFVAASTLSADAVKLATSSAGQIRLWDWATGTESLAIPNLPDLPQKLSFSPDGSLLAGTFNQGVLQVWDTATGQPLVSLHPGGEISGATFVLGGTLLAATQYDGTVLLLGVVP
ncbi:MAG: hypothetical protein Fur0022_42570 [Anaerolineales bacterium]